MMSERVDTDTLHIDEMHVVCPRAGGLDVHKMCITAAVRLCEAGRGFARTAVREFSALPNGLRAMTDWLRSHGVTAAAMEGTGVLLEGPVRGARRRRHSRRPAQCSARQADPREEDRCQRQPVAGPHLPFGLALPSYVPPRRFRQLRQLTRYRRTLVAERSRTRNRVHKTLDHDGLRLGGILSDIFGVNGRRILDGLVAGSPPRRILAGLTATWRPSWSRWPRRWPPRSTRSRCSSCRCRWKPSTGPTPPSPRWTSASGLNWPITSAPCSCCKRFPGIDFGSACTLFVEIGPDLGAFREARHLGAWAGVAPGNNTSAGKRRSGRARKGNPTLRATLARVRPRRRADQKLAVLRLSPDAGRSHRLQTSHPRHRPQAVASHAHRTA